MKHFKQIIFIFTASLFFIVANSFAQATTADDQFSLGKVNYFIFETKGSAKSKNDTTFYNLYRTGKVQRIGKEIKSVVNKLTKDSLVIGNYVVYKNSIAFFKRVSKTKLVLREYQQNDKGLLSVETKVADSKDKNVDSTSSISSIKNPAISENLVLEVVDVQPEYPGGINALRQFLANNINYPDEAIENEVNGTVIATFVVERDGYISDIKIDKKLGYGCDEEVIRVIKKTPKWTPGFLHGKPVRYRFRLPVTFNAVD